MSDDSDLGPITASDVDPNYPDFGDYTSSVYDQWSISVDDFTVPDYFMTYEPDNQDDYKCLSVICPDLSRGASRWTINGRWITIGVYRDEGRPGYDETNIVFRLLPSFTLIKYETIQSIIESCAPPSTSTRRQLYDVTLGQDVKIPRGRSKTTAYDLPVAPQPMKTSGLQSRFGQVYDETGKPLKIQYRADGMPKQVNNMDSNTKNTRVKLMNQPSSRPDVDGDEVVDDKVYVYDFYGIEINYFDRGPYYITDVITRDESVPAPVDNIYRKTNREGEIIYDGGLYDHFGNIVIGIRENNGLCVRVPILPLKLDRFNRPVKNPRPRI